MVARQVFPWVTFQRRRSLCRTIVQLLTRQAARMVAAVIVGLKGYPHVSSLSETIASVSAASGVSRVSVIVPAQLSLMLPV
jgi:hypothetical protein